MKDVVGREIQVGDTVALATRVGNSAELKLREVLGFKVERFNREFAKVKNPETGRTSWASVSNMLVVDFY